VKDKKKKMRKQIAECERISDEIYPLSELLKFSILTFDNCKRIGGCICCYAFIPLRDNNGKLINFKC